MTTVTRERLGLAALALVAAVPRVAGALLRRPWHDEYFTGWLATLSPGDALAALRLDSGPPLPYVLPWLGARLDLPALGVARGVAVLAGVAAVLLAWRAASNAWGERAGWWTAALLAVHPLAVAWSCEGRAYALLLLAVTWAWERLEQLARTGRGAAGLAGAVALAFWSHGLGLLLAPVLALAAWTLAAPLRRHALVGVAAGLASGLPWLGVVVGQPAAAIAWMTRSFAELPWPSKVLAPLRFLSPGGNLGEVADLPWVPWPIEVGAGALMAALLLAAATSLRPVLRQGVALLVPAAALATLAWLGVPVFHPGRGEALYLVPALLLAGGAAASRRARGVAASLLVLAGAWSTAASLHHWALAPPRGEEVMAQQLRAALPRGGTVVVGGYWRLGLWYHLGQGTPAFRFLSVPQEASRHPGWYDDASVGAVDAEVLAVRRELAGHEAQCAVVVSPGISTAPALLWLANVLRLAPAGSVPGGVLWLPAGGATP